MHGPALSDVRTQVRCFHGNQQDVTRVEQPAPPADLSCGRACVEDPDGRSISSVTPVKAESSSALPSAPAASMRLQPRLQHRSAAGVAASCFRTLQQASSVRWRSHLCPEYHLHPMGATAGRNAEGRGSGKVLGGSTAPAAGWEGATGALKRQSAQ